VRLFFVALLFSISFGDFVEAHAGTLVARPLCVPLMIRASFAPLADDQSSTPTDRYFQYLNIFLQNSLDAQDVKILKDFESPPNFVELFAHKIPESFMYRDDIQALLPSVDKGDYKNRLEKIDQAKSKELEHKEKAHEQTKMVEGYLPVIGKEIPDTKDDLPNLLIGADGAFFNERGKIRNLDTGQKVDLDFSDSPLPARHEFIWQVIQGQTWLISYTDTHINVFRATTGERIFKVKETDEISQLDNPRLFLDSNGKLNLAWFRRVKGPNKNVITHIRFCASDSLVINELPLPENIVHSYSNYNENKDRNDGNLHWIESQGGQTFAYSEFTGKRRLDLFADIPIFAPRRMRIHDLTHGVANMVEFGVLRSILHSRIISVIKINESKYQLLMQNFSSNRLLQIHEVTLKDTGKNKNPKWVLNPRPLNFWPWPHDYYIKSFLMPNGEIIYVAEDRDRHKPLRILKLNGELQNTSGLTNVQSTIYQSDGTPVLIGHSNEKDALIFLNLGTMKTSTVRFEVLKAGLYEPIGLLLMRVFPDGSITGYYRHQNSSNIVPVQFYGPFDPKTGQVVP
jgi:hypothetical protein